MPRSVGTDWKSTRLTISVGLLAAAVSAGMIGLAGCSGDAGPGPGDPSPTTDAGPDSPTPELVDAGPITPPGDTPLLPNETPVTPTPEDASMPRDGGLDLAPPDDPSGSLPVLPATTPPEVPAGPGIPPLEPGFVLTKPKVVLSEGHQRLCAVGVGDTMPSVTLPDTAGNSQSLAQLFGQKLTVVVFWKLEHPFANEQFVRLGREVVDPFGAFGVNAVTINVGDSAAAVQAAGQQVAAAFPALLDADGAALATVGTDKLPRTYLLDPAGKILWFDIEYSESTRRELKNAILWHLIHNPVVATRESPPR